MLLFPREQYLRQMSLFECPTEAAFHIPGPGVSFIHNSLPVELYRLLSFQVIKSNLPVWGLAYLLCLELDEVVVGSEEQERGQQYEQTGDDH